MIPEQVGGVVWDSREGIWCNSVLGRGEGGFCGLFLLLNLSGVMEHSGSGEIDLGQIGRRLRRGWILVAALCVTGAIGGFAFTAVRKPVYEARAALVFPAGGGINVGPAIGVQATLGQDNMGLVEGIVMSRDVENLLVEGLNLDREDVRESLVVSQIPIRRQVVLAFRSADKTTGIDALSRVLVHLQKLEEEIGANQSGRRSAQYREAFEQKRELVDELEQKLLDYQKESKTVPTPLDQFTGSAYLMALSEAEMELSKIQKEIEGRKQAARQIGKVAASGLPTGLESETKWRDELLKVSIEVDRAEAKYQPDSSQVKEAREKFESTKRNLVKEISKYVQSVQEGGDQGMVDLFAQELVLKWQLGRAKELAQVAPLEAAEYRRLLGKLELETKARDELQLQADGEEIRGKVETKVWQVLDEPFLEEEPINKKFLMNTGLGFLLGGLLGGVLANGKKDK